jgi:hypothetical protein
MAKQLRLQLGAGVRLSTANGVIPARRAMLESVRIAGAIEVRNVRAVVKADDASCDEVLIGMSVLKKLHVTLNGNKLTMVHRTALSVWHVWALLVAMWAVMLASLIGVPKDRGRSLLRKRRPVSKR